MTRIVGCKGQCRENLKDKTHDVIWCYLNDDALQEILNTRYYLINKKYKRSQLKRPRSY